MNYNYIHYTLATNGTNAFMMINYSPLNLLLQMLLVMLLALTEFTTAFAAPMTVSIHTDNPRDFENFEHHEPSSIGTETTLLVTDRLPYKISFEYMNGKRSLLFLEQKENICITNRVKTPERQAKFLYSKPLNLFVTRRLYQQHHLPLLAPNLLNDKGEIYLPTLFKAHPKRTIVLTNHISYGAVFDQQLGKIAENNKIVRNASGHDNGVMEMFKRRRVDYILLFPQLQLLNEGQGVDKDMVNYPVAGLPHYVLGHFLCANNPKMRQVVKNIDKILQQLYRNNKIFDAHTRRLGNVKPADFKRYYQQAFVVDL